MESEFMNNVHDVVLVLLEFLQCESLINRDGIKIITIGRYFCLIACTSYTLSMLTVIVMRHPKAFMANSNSILFIIYHLL